MSKIALIDDLEQKLSELKVELASLSSLFEYSKKDLEDGKLLSSDLNQKLSNKIEEVKGLQDNFEAMFHLLKPDSEPKSIGEYLNILAECRQKELALNKYRDAIHFFCALYSENEEVQSLLDKEKEIWKSINLDTLGENNLKSMSERFVCLFEAFHEKDERKRFSLIYKLANNFEEGIVEAIFFNELHVGEAITQDVGVSTDCKETENTESDEVQPKISYENMIENIVENKSAEEDIELSPEKDLTADEKTLEEMPDTEEVETKTVVATSVEEKIEDENSDDLPSDGDALDKLNEAEIEQTEEAEPSMQQKKTETEQQKDMEIAHEQVLSEDINSEEDEVTWESLGIDSPEELITKEDNALLSVSLSPKAKAKFSVKEFKKDLLKPNAFFADIKGKCLVEASDMGYTQEELEILTNSSKGFYATATEKLFELGYLKKYSVLGIGYFFALSDRGRQIFISRDSLKFMNQLVKQKIKNMKDDEFIEDSTNSAMTRIMYHTFARKIKLIDNDYPFKTSTNMMDDDYFLQRYENVCGEESFTGFFIASQKIEQFEWAKDLIAQDEISKHYIVLGLNREKARATAQWVLKILESNMPVWYCAYDEDEFFDAATDAFIDLEEVRSGEVPSSESVEEETEEATSSESVEEEAEEATPSEFVEEETEEATPSESVEEEAEEATPSNSVDEDTEEVETKAGIEEAADEVKLDDDIEETIDINHMSDAAEKDELNEQNNASDIEMAVNLEETDKNINDCHEEEQRDCKKAAEVQSEKFEVKHEQVSESLLTEEDISVTPMKMLVSGDFYLASSYLRALSEKNPEYKNDYQQLAYALNDPMNRCNYSSDMMIETYYDNQSERMISEYWMIAAVMRNYFYDQMSYDYSLQSLQGMISEIGILKLNPEVERVLYRFYEFKRDHNKGMDRYADYRKKDKVLFERKLEDIRQEAKLYYDMSIQEPRRNKRFKVMLHLLFDPESELGYYLQYVKDDGSENDNSEMFEELEQFLKENYIKKNSEISREHIDEMKINEVIRKYWDESAKYVKDSKKTSDLMSSFKTNTEKRLEKSVAVLADYVFLVKLSEEDKDPIYVNYQQVKQPLLDDLDKAVKILDENPTKELLETAGKIVLKQTLLEMRARLDGTYQKGSEKYFYIDFLKNNQILLDEDFLPILDNVSQLPNFSARNRILKHFKQENVSFEQRIQDIFNGGDDYGSADLIFKYFRFKGYAEDKLTYANVIDEAIRHAEEDMKNKSEEFVADLELAQSYGQIDNTEEDTKEAMIMITDYWLEWAKETHNYGFFASILDGFRDKISQDAHKREGDLKHSLEVHIKDHPEYEQDEHIQQVIKQIEDRIVQQNYAAAEDLLNRLTTGDIDFDINFDEEDYFMKFLEEYDINYKKVANLSLSLKKLLSEKINKDTRGGEKLIENWPSSAPAGESKIRTFLGVLGFHPDMVKEESFSYESYSVTLKKPENGKKINYKHPIWAFGSNAEKKAFRVVCLFGKYDTSRLIDVAKDFGNIKDTIVLLDYALDLPDRRSLARKTKRELGDKIFAVIDRVVLGFLAKNYTQTSINRLLMSIIMPFASYQPYIDKSSVVMPPEMFIGRQNELNQIESATGVNLVYGGRQLGKTALLRMAKKDIDYNENGDRAILIDVKEKDYKAVAKIVSETLYEEGVLKEKNITEDWEEIARDIKHRLRDETNPIPYLLLMLDEADAFIESCEAIAYKPFDILKDIQSIDTGRFKFVVAGLHNLVRFKNKVALKENNGLPHLDSLTVKPFRSPEARELLEGPLSYLGFRLRKDEETEALISTIFGTTNYFPGLIQLYCKKMIETMRRDYAGYAERETPPYYIKKEHIKKVLAEQSLQESIREKFFITLKVADDVYYYVIALLVAYYYRLKQSQNGCSADDVLELANDFYIKKLTMLTKEQISALMEEMRELNILQYTSDGRYRFTRYSFSQMMGSMANIETEIDQYMED